MERAQVIALAVIVAALALFGVGYVVDGSATLNADSDVVAGAHEDASRHGIGLSNRESESRRGSQRSGPGGLVPEPRRGRRAGSSDDDGDEGGAEVIPGSRRGASGVGRSGSGSADDELAANGLSEADLRAARTGTLPRAGGGAAEAPAAPHHPSEPVEQPPVQDQHQPPPVLLSIPLKGSIDPEQGGGPTQADGVVVDGDAVDFTDQAQYTLPAAGHVDGNQGTISFDVQPHWDGGDPTNNSLLQIRDENLWANDLQIVKNLDSLRFIIIDSTGVESDVNIYIHDWQPEDSHQITATWGGAVMTLYVDGEQVGQNTLRNYPKFGDTTPIHVGSDFPGSQYNGANGRISNLTIYGRAVNPSEIK